MASIKAELKRRARIEEDIVLRVLDVVENDPSVTQRSVAIEVGIALGLANAYLKRCIRKGLIKVSQIPPRRYAYYLTPRGFAEKSRLTASYLSHSFSFFRHARAQCGELFAELSTRNNRKVVLIGEGELAEIAILVAPEFSVEIAGVVAGTSVAERLVASLNAFDQIDAVIVTALIDSRKIFDTAIKTFGESRVFAPALLRVHPSVS